MKNVFLFLIFLVSLQGCQNSNSNKAGNQLNKTAMCLPVTTDRDWYNSDNKAPLFEGLGDYSFPISTNNKSVQQYINQGMVLAYGFNHAEAARSFYYATKLDSNCAMAHWGYAYVLGPNYNAGMESDNYERAYIAIQKALELSKNNISEKERMLIDALSKRYVASPVEDRSILDQNYAKAMKLVYNKYPSDADISTLYAESLMNLHPWDLQDKDGNDKLWTPEIIAILEKSIAEHPKHPGLNHFYIHAVEASNKPERALTSAELFYNNLVPNSGHLVHMPSHIYIRTGDYHKGTLANIRALKIDSLYVNACNAQGAYPLAYYPHNQHFMAATATLEGNSKWAIYAAEELQLKANYKLMKEPGWGTIQHYYTIPFYVYVKFGKWDKIIALQNELPELAYPTAILHYAKGMAYLNKGNSKAAKLELSALNNLATKSKLKEITIWELNTVYDLVQIASKVLEASILAHDKQYNQSIAKYNEAIAIEDALNYNEPPDWFFSVRHMLGAVQLKATQYNDAIVTYNQDLKKFPHNGWALNGLASAYSKLGDKKNQQESEVKFRQAWKTADIELNTSIVR